MHKGDLFYPCVAAATFLPNFLKFWTLLFYFILLRSVWIHELRFILPFATVWFEVMSIVFMLFGKPLPVGKRINSGVLKTMHFWSE